LSRVSTELCAAVHAPDASLRATVFGYIDVAAIAKGFACPAPPSSMFLQFLSLFDACAAQDKAQVRNFRVSDKVVVPRTRRTVSRGHGKM
jgi:hypothetical protein